MRNLIFVFLLISFFAEGQYVFDSWSQDELAKANSGANVSYLSKKEKEVLLLMNLVRMDPVKFKETFLKAYQKNNKLNARSNALKSLNTELGKMKAVGLLYPNADLVLCAKEHALYMGKIGQTGHKGKGGKSSGQRIAKFVNWKGWCAENCQYGYQEPIDIVMDLLIDEGVSGYGHRKNMLSPRALFVGISMQPHKKYQINTVMDFVDGIE